MFRKTFVWTEIVAGEHSVRVDLKEFTHLRLFHGCRPAAVNSYYTDGIRVLSSAELAKRFREIFADLDTVDLDSAIASCQREPRDQRVDAALDLRFLVKHASHYLVQGSEMLKAWARALPYLDGNDPTQRLKSIGRPTAFLVDAPIEAVASQDLDELQLKLDELASKGTLYACDDGDLVGFTVSFSKGVPSEWIVRHDFIDVATDPDDRSHQYRFVPDVPDQSTSAK